MRQDLQQHRSRNWRIHELAAHLDLLDVWEYPIDAGENDPSLKDLTTKSVELLDRQARGDACRLPAVGGEVVVPGGLDPIRPQLALV